MRLLDTTTFELSSNSLSVFKQEGYAIFSHRWSVSEITFKELGGHIDTLRAAGTTPLKSPQQEKIRGACQIARAKGIRWMWIDTCCLDKSSTAEISEFLNSMFQWYRDAKLCITYLSDVVRKGDGREDFSDEGGRPSVWFSRGWALQELLAPRHLEFFDKNWDPIGDRAELAEQIEKTTNIQSKYLKGETEGEDPRAACIAMKFSWIANRQTERDEDMAYSILGLCGVTMGPQYGEGWGAFMRLQKELLSISGDESLFAWKMAEADAGLKLLSRVYSQQQEDWRENEWGLLAPRPEFFKECGQMTVVYPGITKQHISRHGGGSQVRQQGLLISYNGLYEVDSTRRARFSWRDLVPFYATCGIWACVEIPRELSQIYDDFPYALNCWDRDESGGTVRVQIWLRIIGGTQHVQNLKRIRCTEVIKDLDGSRPSCTTGYGVVLQPWALKS